MTKHFILFFICSLFFIGSAIAGDEVHWSYAGTNGPDSWGNLRGCGLCSSGKAQSPVNITKAVKDGGLHPIDFLYAPASPFTLVNNGHTWQCNVEDHGGTYIAGEPYELLQFHFHSTSEHTVDGQAYPLEMHLVHKSVVGNKFAVIGILFEEGAENPFLAKLWPHFPKQKGTSPDKHGPDLLEVLPEPSVMRYFTYSGSLTTPPCTEGLTWVVLKDIQQVSKEQIASFAKVFGNNARPVQPLNGRALREASYKE